MLTIVVPTYNRKEEISVLLPTILNSMEYKNGLIKLIVSDNCSTDDSISFLTELSERHLFTLNVNEVNLGFAGNLSVLISLVKTDYFWIMGSDEIITDNSISIVLNAVKNRSCDVFVGNCMYQNGNARNFYRNNFTNSDLRILDIKSYAGFLYSCTEFSGAFAFISTLIVKKRFWDSIILNDYESNHPYIHLLAINKAISKRIVTVGNIDYILVFTGCAENEFNINKVKHLKLDMETLVYISKEYFNSNELLKKSFRRFFSNYRILLLLKNQADSSSWNELSVFFSYFKIRSIFYKKRTFDVYIESFLRAANRVRKKVI